MLLNDKSIAGGIHHTQSQIRVQNSSSKNNMELAHLPPKLKHVDQWDQVEVPGTGPHT